MAKGPRLCVNCESHRERAVSFNDKIIHECVRTVDLVSGRTKPTPCSVVRTNPRLCGEMGKWFKASEDATLASDLEPAE